MCVCVLWGQWNFAEGSNWCRFYEVACGIIISLSLTNLLCHNSTKLQPVKTVLYFTPPLTSTLPSKPDLTLDQVYLPPPFPHPKPKQKTVV